MNKSVIIVGVDGSATAARAAASAARLADALAAQLQVVCAYERAEIERVEIGGERYELSQRSSAEAVTQEAVTALLTERPGIKVVPVAASGKPAEVLITAAEQSGAEMIVIGNRRVQTAGRIFGSVATDVARKAPCDVYIAHTSPSLAGSE